MFDLKLVTVVILAVALIACGQRRQAKEASKDAGSSNVDKMTEERKNILKQAYEKTFFTGLITGILQKNIQKELDEIVTQQQKKLLQEELMRLYYNAIFLAGLPNSEDKVNEILAGEGGDLKAFIEEKFNEDIKKILKTVEPTSGAHSSVEATKDETAHMYNPGPGGRNKDQDYEKLSTILQRMMERRL
uniref:Uncharacterized protein n=1 Tax=Branchiostoma floridae TaxID=7739 RepID=C3Y6W5_BRAFL|eukprot:XP_002608065.1 hypothetical protein BRAFLDRAFT_120930 [Branchiostoma floridae]